MISTPKKRVLVPSDFSSYSEAALLRAVDYAARSSTELHLIHVTSGPLDDDMRQHMLDKLERSLEPHCDRELAVRRAVLVGVPHREIIEYAQRQKVNLIIMGTHGRTGVAHLALGSVAERVLRLSACPVLVVKPEESEGTHFEPEPIEPAETVDREERDASPALDLIQRALSLRATDIHMDPASSKSCSVRLRIDGRLQEYCRLDRHVAEHLAQQFKLMANLDIAEPFRPQEGRLRLPPWRTELEVRITTCPVAGGEALALRLFDRAKVLYPLDQLGFSETAPANVRHILQTVEGIVLVTGPTAAGKTTTVYSMLEVLGSGQRNIVTIEDPVEFPTPSARQMSVDPRHDITMTTGLRTLLRMDPDIIFVGEIRDAEAAEIAMRAASSGRHVFSTLHTRDVAATVTTLRDLRVDNRSLAGNLTGIINQRLVRSLCTECCYRQPITDEQRVVFSQYAVDAPDALCEGRGCEHCRGTGFHGRTGVFETVVADSAFAEAIARNDSEEELRQVVRSSGTLSLTSDALLKVRDGVTSFKEAVTMRWL